MSTTPRTDAAYFEADEIEHATDADVTIAMRDFARDLERENAELRTDGQRWQNEHLRLLAENAELRKALNLAFSIHQMSDQQLGNLIENCRKVINSKP